ncbi:MAG: hypothetical protein GY750_03110 [Lentisphaerae bacterium]|nr:hypothetical protein [Lentisphaerota bacterium]MCP4100407.1 hypothetical protein [Lentisphaerota bacterium]
MHKVHYIWMGVPILEDYVRNISHVLINSGHQVHVWTDKTDKTADRFHHISESGKKAPWGNAVADRLKIRNVSEIYGLLDTIAMFIIPPQRKTIKDMFSVEHDVLSDHLGAEMIRKLYFINWQKKYR